MKAEALSLPMPWGVLEALHWRNPGAPRILCLHGWLDNAASFIPLADLLADFELLALDFAGHGLSSHRPANSRYYFADYVFDVDQAMRQLDWDRCHIMGHSMGAGVATCLAAATPEQVDRLVLLDSVGVYTLPVEKAATQLRASVLSVRKDRSILRPFESIEAAMAARQRIATLGDEAARLLCERALIRKGDFYQWRTDPRLNWRSPGLYTENQALNLLKAVESRALVITSPVVQSHLGQDRVMQRLASIRDCLHLKIDGDHHFHMEQPGQVAEWVSRFLQDTIANP